MWLVPYFVLEFYVKSICLLQSTPKHKGLTPPLLQVFCMHLKTQEKEQEERSQGPL